MDKNFLERFLINFSLFFPHKQSSGLKTVLLYNWNHFYQIICLKEILLLNLSLIVILILPNVQILK